MNQRDIARDTPSDPTDLVAELRALRQEVERLNGHRFVRLQNSTMRMLGFQFMRGLALGLGTVLGASVLVSLLAYFLSNINFIPIIGDWATEIATQIEEERRLRQSDGPLDPSR